MRLPKNVAFKGQDGSYLAAAWLDGHPYLTFDTAHSDPGHEIFPASDGAIRIKSNVTGMFWRTTNNGYIVADHSGDISQDDQALFMPYPVPGSNSNVIALGSCFNNIYCMRVTSPTGIAVLQSYSTLIQNDCHLEFEKI